MEAEAQLHAKIEAALEKLAEAKGTEYARQIGSIAISNLESGRVQFFLEHQHGGTVQSYVERLDEHFEALHDYLNSLQVERATEVWLPFFEKLQKLAYNLLMKKGLIPGRQTFDLAIDCATDAAMALVNARFPYDTGIDPWAYNFIKFASRKRINEEIRWAAKITEMLFEAIPARCFGDWQDHTDHWARKIDLLNAMQQLSPNRCRVLKLRYEQGFSSKEIATELGKSVSAVDKLHHDAMKQLQKFFEDPEN